MHELIIESKNSRIKKNETIFGELAI